MQQPTTLIAHHARYRPEHAAVVFADGRQTRRLTWRQFHRRVNRLANALLALGIKKGDRVATVLPNSLELLEIYWAVPRIGAVLVPLNTRLTARELSFCMDNSGASLLFFKNETTGSGKHYGSLLAEVLPELAGSRPGELKAAQVPRLTRVVDLAVPAERGAESFEVFLARGDALDAARLSEAEAAVAPMDVSLIAYTSGTTSTPKGAMLNHAGILRGALEVWTFLAAQERDAVFSVQPYFHSGGAIPQMLAPIVAGCRIVTQPYFNAGRALQLMEREGVTVLVGHQPHFVEYVNHADFAPQRLKIERGLIIGPPETFRMVRDKMGIQGLVSAYSSSETQLVGTASSLSDPEEARFNTNGRPSRGVEVEIRDPDTGALLGVGEEGEIFMKVPYPMLGYLNDPVRTAEVLDDKGWYRTGDKGVLRPDGNMRALGRVRDMIRVGGENLSGAEV